jgi:hypothetical protein
MRLQADCRARRVDADGKVIKSNFRHAPPDLFWVMCVVSERLRVRQKQELLMTVLASQTVCERTDIVADMERTCCAVSGKNDWFGHKHVLVEKRCRRTHGNKKGRPNDDLG